MSPVESYSPRLVELGNGSLAGQPARVVVAFRSDTAATAVRHHLPIDKLPNVLAATAPGFEGATSMGNIQEIALRIAEDLVERQFSRVVVIGLSGSCFTAVEIARALESHLPVDLGLLDPPRPDSVLDNVTEAFYAPHTHWPGPAESPLVRALETWKLRKHATVMERLEDCKNMLWPHQAELHAFISSKLPSLAALGPAAMMQRRLDWMSHLILIERYAGEPYESEARCLLGVENLQALGYVKRLAPKVSIRTAAGDHRELISQSTGIPFALWLHD